MDRPRHKKHIDELKALNVKLKLITDGDVSGALLVTDKKYDVDIFLGIGGGPEGVLAASALDAYGCFFQGKFLFDTKEDKLRAKKMGIENFEKKYELNEIVSGDSIFCATGITSGDLVQGIDIQKDTFTSETLVTHKSSRIRTTVKSKYKILMKSISGKDWEEIKLSKRLIEKVKIDQNLNDIQSKLIISRNFSIRRNFSYQK